MDSIGVLDNQMYSDILAKYRNMRSANIKLLEEKRSLLLRITELNKVCMELQSKEKKEDEPASDVSSTTDKMTDNAEQRFLFLRQEKLENELLKRTTDLIEAKEQNIRYREEISELKDKLSNCACGIWDQPDHCRKTSVDEIEAMKHQLVIYQEDFKSEKTDKERAEAEGRLLKGKLREAEDFIHALKQETVRYENALRGLSDEKMTLKKEIRRLSTSSLPLSPVRRTYTEMRGKAESFDCDESDVIARNSRKPKLMRMPSEVSYDHDLCRD